MARFSKTFTPASAARFVAALRGGALVVAAAKEAGVAIATLYWRRHREPAFAEAWDEAVEASSGPVWRPLPGRPLRLGRKRRVRFAGWRRELFLAQLALTCDTRDSAAAAGVHVSTVYRRIGRDPAFARACQDALERGYARLEALAEREREAEAARLREEIEPIGEMVQDFDRMLKLMARFERPAPRAGAKRRKARTHWEMAAALDRKLAALEVRERDAPGP